MTPPGRRQLVLLNTSSVGKHWRIALGTSIQVFDRAGCAGGPSRWRWQLDERFRRRVSNSPRSPVAGSWSQVWPRPADAAHPMVEQLAWSPDEMKSKTELAQGWAVILVSERTDLFAEALVS